MGGSASLRATTSPSRLAVSMTPSTLTTSTAWWATRARPDSVTMSGWATPCSSQTAVMAAMTSMA